MSISSGFPSPDRSRVGQEPAAPPAPVELEAAEFLRRRAPDDPVLDVRTRAEFADEHLEGASHVDILEDRFMERVEELGLDPAEPVYLYCRSGNRSGHAARILRQNGYPSAFNVGGLDDLARAGAPTRS
jgi:phage shock protein E